MLDIDIKTIPHKQQKYDTCGNYWRRGNKYSIRVSDMRSRKFELLVAIHELIEQALVEDRGITDQQITEFDKRFEAERIEGLHDTDVEPGFDPYSPYLKEHAFASKVERMLARELAVDWKEYEKAVNNLSYK